MSNERSSFDLARMMFGIIFISILILASFWIVQPFILGFSWASMVVITTWPLMLKLQHHFFGKRYLAILVLIILLIMLFVIPIGLTIESIVSKAPDVIEFTKRITQEGETFELPKLLWLDDIPMIGHSLFNGWQRLISDGGQQLLGHVQPYAGKTATWLLEQVTHIGNFMIHSTLMILFSALLYYKGEAVAASVKSFALRLSPSKGDLVVTLTAQAIRAVAFGVVLTALFQAIFAGIGLTISGFSYVTLLTLVAFFLCLIQVGPMPVLIPAIIWLYWTGDNTWGTILLIWTTVAGVMDNVIKPILIRIGANLPLLLILCGVIGGMIAFGLIGLFLGPVVLAVGHRLLSAWINEADLSPTLQEESLFTEDIVTTHDEVEHAKTIEHTKTLDR